MNLWRWVWARIDGWVLRRAQAMLSADRDTGREFVRKFEVNLREQGYIVPRPSLMPDGTPLVLLLDEIMACVRAGRR